MYFINKTIDYLKDNMMLVYAAAGAVLLLIVILMIVLIVKSKKSKNKAVALDKSSKSEAAPQLKETQTAKPVETKPESKPAPAPREIKHEPKQPAPQPDEVKYTAPVYANSSREYAEAKPSGGNAEQEKQEVKYAEKTQPAPIKEQVQQKVSTQNTVSKPSQPQQQPQPVKYTPSGNAGKPVLPLNKEMEKVLSGNESAKYTGKWVVFEKGGLFYYALYASNGELLVQSEGYSSDKGAISGISTFKRNLISGKFVVFQDKSNNYYFKLSSVNNRLIAVGQTYPSRQSCESSIESVKRFSQTAVFVNEIGSK